MHIRGLMTIAPFVENPEENRGIFQKLYQFSVDIDAKNIDNVTMGVLSMGMSGDFEVAIEEGATMVRVGTSTVSYTHLIILFLLIVYECLVMAARARDLGGRLLCAGMATLIAFQAFANIAVATGIFPNTGLPLPFIKMCIRDRIRPIKKTFLNNMLNFT